MSIERFVALTSANPAKLVGLYPRKGAITPGSDADITIIDTSIRKRLSMDDSILRTTAYGRDGRFGAGRAQPCCGVRSW